MPGMNKAILDDTIFYSGKLIWCDSRNTSTEYVVLYDLLRF